MSSDTFFDVIQRRLFKYRDAIFGLGRWSPNVASAMLYSIQRVKSLNAQDSFFCRGFWGYGINNICDGKDSYTHFDVEDISKINNLNKHHEDYRNLLILVFKVEGSSFFVSTFSIDSCGGTVNANINTKYDLRDFENARIITRNYKTIVEFFFKGLTKPISFQIDEIHIQGICLVNRWLNTILIQ